MRLWKARNSILRKWGKKLMVFRRLTHPLVTLCVPFGRNPLPQWAVSFACIQPPINAITAMNITIDKVREDARHKLADDCIAAESKYMMCLDDDVTVPPFILRKLLYAFETLPDDVMAVGGIYCTKTIPPMPAVFRKIGEGPAYDWKLGEVFECEVAPLGMLLVKTKVFDYLSKPWFKDVDSIDEARILGLADESSDAMSASFTDDAYFCHKIRQAGFKVMAHGGVLGIHWHSMTGQSFILPADAPPITREMENRWGKAECSEGEYYRRLVGLYGDFYGPLDFLQLDERMKMEEGERYVKA